MAGSLHQRHIQALGMACQDITGWSATPSFIVLSGKNILFFSPSACFCFFFFSQPIEYNTYAGACLSAECQTEYCLSTTMFQGCRQGMPLAASGEGQE